MFSSFFLIPGPFSTGTISYFRGTSETIVPILQPYNGCMHCVQTDNHFRQLLTNIRGKGRPEDRRQGAVCKLLQPPGH